MNLTRKNKSQKREVTSTNRAPKAQYYRSDTSQRQTSPFGKRPAPKPARSLWPGRAFDVVIFAILIGLCLFFLSLDPRPKVTVNDESYRGRGEYINSLNTEFAKLMNKSKITLNEETIEKALIAKYPEVSSISINMPLLSRKADVAVNISAPQLKIIGKSGEYVVNSQGVVIGTTETFAGSGELVAVTDESGFSLTPGRQVLQQDSIAFITSLIKQLKKSGIEISALSLPARPQEIDMRTADRPYFVKFRLGSDAAGQIGQYLATREQLTRDGITPSEYIDARVPGKVFYK